MKLSSLLAVFTALTLLLAFCCPSLLAQTGVVDITDPAISTLSANPEIAQALLDFGAITPTTNAPSGLGLIVDCDKLMEFVNIVDGIIADLELEFEIAELLGDSGEIEEAGDALANARNIGTNVHTVARALGSAAGCPCI